MSTRAVAHAPRAALLALPRRVRRTLLPAVVLAVALAAGYFAWLRDSSLVAVENVEVSGLTVPSAARVERALVTAARDMTTLHVRREELLKAVAGFPVVQGLAVEADFPSGLRIRVLEHRPVALLRSGSGSVPVAGDGTLLPDVEVGARLPALDARATTTGDRLSDERARALVAVASAAPGALAGRTERIRLSARGILVELRDGPELVFGAASRPRAKWLAAAAVLADESSSGAAYIDVRIPERPAAGGLAGGAQAGEEPLPSPAPEQVQGEAAPAPAQSNPQPEVPG